MFSVSDCVAIINQTLPEPHAGLLSGILFGTQSTLAPDIKQALITTGTLHIAALSGMNITILVGIVNGVFLRWFSRRIASGITIFVIAGFIWFVGPTSSIIRAGIMGSVSLLGVITGRKTVPLVIWGIAVASMLLVRPFWISDLSFQLSVLASLGMILFHKELEKDQKQSEKKERSLFRMIHHHGLLAFLYDDLRTTLAAQVFTIPLIFFTFHRISLVAPLTNVCIGWTIPIITVLGMLLVCLGFVWLPLGQIVAYGVWVFLTYIIGVITWTENIPFASVGW